MLLRPSSSERPSGLRARSRCRSGSKTKRPLSLPEHADLGLTIAWYTFLPDRVLKAAAWEFMQAFARDGLQAWQDFQTAHPDNPFARERGAPDLLGLQRVYELDQKYAIAGGGKAHA